VLTCLGAPLPDDEALYANFTQATAYGINRIEPTTPASWAPEGRRQRQPGDVILLVDARGCGVASRMPVQPVSRAVLEQRIPAQFLAARRRRARSGSACRRGRVSSSTTRHASSPADVDIYEKLAAPALKASCAWPQRLAPLQPEPVRFHARAPRAAGTEAWLKGTGGHMARAPRAATPTRSAPSAARGMRSALGATATTSRG